MQPKTIKSKNNGCDTALGNLVNTIIIILLLLLFSNYDHKTTTITLHLSIFIILIIISGKIIVFKHLKKLLCWQYKFSLQWQLLLSTHGTARKFGYPCNFLIWVHVWRILILIWFCPIHISSKLDESGFEIVCLVSNTENNDMLSDSGGWCVLEIMVSIAFGFFLECLTIKLFYKHTHCCCCHKITTQRCHATDL